MSGYLRTSVRRVIELALRVFFRQIELEGVERVPASGPVVFVLNHPNALIDPGLAMIGLRPRDISFLAKSTLWDIPVVGQLVAAFEAIPVYRRQDAGGGPVDNSRTFTVAREVLERGGAIALFPEGTSHSSPRLRPIKTGAARIALGAGVEGLVIVPAGLDYEAKQIFRSSALLYFGEPITVPLVSQGESGEPARDDVLALTRSIEEALGAVTLQAEHVEALRLVDRAERVFSSIASSEDEPDLGERFELRRRLLEGYHRLRTEHGARVARAERRLAAHERLLRTLRLDHDDVPGPGDGLGAEHAWAFALLVAMLPLALVGLVTHYPAYRLIGFLAKRLSNGEDDMIATLKVLGAMLLFPTTWIIVGVVSGFVFGLAFGLIAGLCLAPLSGYLSLLFFERLEDLAGDLRGMIVLSSRRGLAARLQRERRWIHDEILALGELLDDGDDDDVGAATAE